MRYGKYKNAVSKVSQRSNKEIVLWSNHGFDENFDEELNGQQTCGVSMTRRRFDQRGDLQKISKLDFEKILIEIIDWVSQLKLEGDHYQSDTFHFVVTVDYVYRFYIQPDKVEITYYIMTNEDSMEISIRVEKKEMRLSSIEECNYVHKNILSRFKSYQKQLKEML